METKCTIMGCRYENPHSKIFDYVNNLIIALSKASHEYFLMGDFNINMMNVDCDAQTSPF